MASPYDNLDRTGCDLSDREDMDNLFIEGLCLSQEIPNAKVLPPNLKDVTFSYCNLDNVFIPPGNVLQNCSNRLFKVQNDGNDWLVDDALKPLKPLDEKLYDKLNLNKDPNDIPPDPLEKPVDVLKKEQLEALRSQEIQDALDIINAKYKELNPLGVEAAIADAGVI